MSQGKLLVVDDDAFILDAYQSFLGGAGYEVCTASDYEQAIALVDASFDLALVDIRMGDKSGIDVLKFIRSHNPDCAVVMVSGNADKRNAIDSLREGATDYLEKPVAPDVLLHVVQRWLSYHFLKQENSRLNDYKAMYEALQSSEAKYKQLSMTLLENLKQSIQAFVNTLEARDPYTAGHQRRVCDLAKVIALEMDLPEHDVEGIYLAAAIHDLGKIHIPADILSKPSKLTDLEYQIIKMHPQTGYDILKNVEYPWPICDIILQHHERLDGSGYPNGLKGDDILMGARVLCVADTIEAMLSHRPYRTAMGIDTVLNEIESGRDKRFDGRVVDACVNLFRVKDYVLPN